jgi:hypothetical protein
MSGNSELAKLLTVTHLHHRLGAPKMPTAMEAQSNSLSQHLVLHLHRLEARLINGVRRSTK